MKALRVVACVVCMAAFLVNQADAEFRWDDFFLGTLGVHTLDGIGFGGMTGFIGASGGTKGFGLLGSYEVGSADVLGYDATVRLMNLSGAFTYRIQKSLFLLSYGVAGGGVEIEDFDIEEFGSGTTFSITYVYETGSVFNFMAQARRQGQGLMLSAGVGF